MAEQNNPHTLEEARKHVLEQAALLPELLGGLDFVVSGDETSDLTCAAIKKIAGKRDKGAAPAGTGV